VAGVIGGYSKTDQFRLLMTRTVLEVHTCSLSLHHRPLPCPTTLQYVSCLSFQANANEICSQELERDIFGGSDSELSEEEFTEEAATRPRQRSRSQNASTGGESEDDYVQDAPTKKKSKPRKQRTADGVEPGASRKRKRKAPPPVEINMEELPPQEGKAFNTS